MLCNSHEEELFAQVWKNDYRKWMNARLLPWERLEG